MKNIEGLLVGVVVISMIGYVLYSSIVWLALLIATLIGSIIWFFIDQEHKAKSH